ncbi:SigE family RNA polymerase sigma factor [Pseudofrankia asymbiotica]|uniref:RNA polymerase subunit sigma-24 n=1 Tax=Pseudofrankia asymbiotica TaxID=1834516 RepID=A0A1V2I3G9_9ACTN|nr:SigE family RNA polymerase sigma factor [Pseudofrankia asymbiotica]ONH23546.1 RNA polymerase subunit sigma-24 [Pseudofrankia asymbiotica]
MRADEEQSFEKFVATAAKRLLLSATLLVGGDWAAGEDLLQGAFERTYRHWPKIANRQPEAYVRRALVNAATSRWRGLRARAPEVPLVVDGSWTADASGLSADHADAVSERASLVRALLSLPPRQRAVIVLRYLEDLPEAEVAAALGCSIGSVRSQASRGLVRLRADDELRGLAGEPSPPGPAPIPDGPGRTDVLTNEPSPSARPWPSGPRLSGSQPTNARTTRREAR